MTDPITIRPCRREEWPVFAECVYAMWRDIGTAPQEIKAGWREEILRFMETATHTAQFQGCVAVAGNQVIGSAGGQIWTGLSPQIFQPSYRLRGYLWGVYVAPAYRGRGIAQALTTAVVAHLHSVGCTQVHLHASPAGRPIYEKLGFTQSSEMKLLLPTVGRS